jgi:hypothetical protein
MECKVKDRLEFGSNSTAAVCRGPPFGTTDCIDQWPCEAGCQLFFANVYSNHTIT